MLGVVNVNIGNISYFTDIYTNTIKLFMGLSKKMCPILYDTLYDTFKLPFVKKREFLNVGKMYKALKSGAFREYSLSGCDSDS